MRLAVSAYNLTQLETYLAISQQIARHGWCSLAPRMNQHELRERTKMFAKRIVRFCHSLPSDWDVREIGKQLLRSGTSVAANYRACTRARSDKEFCSKLAVVVEEADESQMWIELLPEAAPTLDAKGQKELFAEATELTAIFTASHRTARTNLKKKRAERKKGRAN
jgi:four helix bundle protein